MSASRFVPTAARFVLGAIFFVFGLNGFLHFLPQPALPEKAMPFLGGLMAAGYMFPLIKGTEVIASVLLLSNRYVPLALTLLAPIIVNITLFHLILAPSYPMIVVILASEITLAYAYRHAFASMLASRVQAELGEGSVLHAQPVPGE